MPIKSFENLCLGFERFSCKHALMLCQNILFFKLVRILDNIFGRGKWCFKTIANKAYSLVTKRRRMEEGKLPFFNFFFVPKMSKIKLFIVLKMLKITTFLWKDFGQISMLAQGL